MDIGGIDLHSPEFYISIGGGDGDAAAGTDVGRVDGFGVGCLFGGHLGAADAAAAFESYRQVAVIFYQCILHLFEVCKRFIFVKRFEPFVLYLAGPLEVLGGVQGDVDDASA